MTVTRFALIGGRPPDTGIETFSTRTVGLTGLVVVGTRPAVRVVGHARLARQRVVISRQHRHARAFAGGVRDDLVALEDEPELRDAQHHSRRSGRTSANSTSCAPSSERPRLNHRIT